MKIQYAPMGPVSANCYVLTDDVTGKTAVIDPAVFGTELKQMLTAPEIASIDCILLTHRHFDHILGAASLQKATGAPVFIGEKDAEALTDPVQSLAVEHGLPQDPIKADRLLRDGDRISLGSMEIAVLYTPGHTVGGICFLTDSTLFSGDTLFAGCMGRTDLPTGSEKEILESLMRLKGLPGDYRVLPGHGPETTLAAERRQNPFMRG